ncbi:hypothetical protein [Benzoatithermus flavus]|uniref:Surface antigen domain-containing protein n=1 Tax=Benzoatithermus flavus TaxID=3108223 RepID=A0ABU8XXN9_9PROT
MQRRSTTALFALALLLAACVGTKDDGSPLSHADLRDADVAIAARAMQQALETLPDGRRLDWKGYVGTGGSFKPFRTYVSTGGYYCRQYTEELHLYDRTSTFKHEACRDEQGRWIWL